MPVHVIVASQVASALAQGRPVVALESTLFAHGLPEPDNLAVARDLCEAVVAHGAVAAPIGIIDGQAIVGLSDEHLERLCTRSPRPAKVGVADLPAMLGSNHDGATTVSATCALAARAGVEVFATGGIGGVHRGDADDVSSDLIALSRFPVAVVCSGAKSMLDLPRTLERLETLGVPVIGYRTSEFPAFYCQGSGLALEHRADSAHDAARMVCTQRALGHGGIVIANPIAPHAALPADELERVIEQAVGSAAAAGIGQKQVTPHLLAAVARATGGRSVAANRQLALDNARLAAEIAVQLVTFDRPPMTTP